MTHKPKESDLSQYQKFKEAARELKADDSEEAFDAQLKKIATASRQKEKKPASK
ncbi:hypothetical protein [Ollibium composti]|uniref:hypothetical protein n=1 Tax=Ollibium composti TaxID=2675109 RepID=UPI001454E0CE|nr:hypothetical protein [Mesorhizobium composti]